MQSEASAPRVLVVDGERSHDVFDVVSLDGEDLLRVRSPFLFEIGEELVLRIEQAGAVTDAIGRVRAHTGPADGRITELELSDRSEPRRLVTG